MKTADEIRKETPLSITSTDNPIFKATKGMEVLRDNVETPEKGDFIIQKIEKGTPLRLLACKQVESGVSPYRWGEYSVAWIPNDKMEHVSGSLGEREIEKA